MADALEKLIHDLGGVVVRAKVGDCALAQLGHVVQQVTVDGWADSEAENASSAQAFVDLGKDLGLVADVAIRKKRDQTQPLRIVGEIQGSLDASEHHRSPFAVQ